MSAGSTLTRGGVRIEWTDDGRVTTTSDDWGGKPITIQIPKDQWDTLNSSPFFYQWDRCKFVDLPFV